MTYLEKYFEIHPELNRNNYDVLMRALLYKCPDFELFDSESTLFDGCRNDCHPDNVDRIACVSCWTREVPMED